METRSSSKEREKKVPDIKESLHIIQLQMTKMKSSLESLHAEVNKIKVELNTIRELQPSLEHPQAELHNMTDTVTSLQLTVKYKVNV